MSVTGKNRIAICFSGQPRTWRKCYETWRQFLDIDQADIFCHLWNFNTKPNSVSTDQHHQALSQQEIDDLVGILKPKKIIIESHKTIMPFRKKQAITYPPFLSQFYGIMKAARLKKQYEIEHDWQYDVVARARYDSYFQEPVITSNSTVEENTMHGFHFGWNKLTNRGRIGDIFWMADSQTYDIIADYYLNLHSIESKFFLDPNNLLTPEYVFFHYIKKNNINIHINHWDIKLFRNSSEESFSKDKNGYEIW
jgi:hypothetical protein